MYKPTFYWTGSLKMDAEFINRPHIEKEGEQENRIKETEEIFRLLKGTTEFHLSDALNIQNMLLKKNNWRQIVPGLRTHNVKISEEIPPDFSKVEALTRELFPLRISKYATQHGAQLELLEWYRRIQTIHPLSDLNGRTFGIIVALLNATRPYKLESMSNLAMQRKIKNLEAIDIAKCDRDAEDNYILDTVKEGADCDAREEQWIWSIGKHMDTGVILASTSNKFYENPEFECLWLR